LPEHSLIAVHFPPITFGPAIDPEITRFTFNFTDALEAGTVVKGEYMDMCYGLHFFKCITGTKTQTPTQCSIYNPSLKKKSDANRGVFTGTLN